MAGESLDIDIPPTPEPETPAADAAATVPAEGAPDTVQPEAAPDPIQQYESIVSPAADEPDAELEEALEAIQSDDALSDGQKKAESYKLKLAGEDRATRRRAAKTDNYSNFTKADAKQYGVTPEQVDETWQASWRECAKVLGKNATQDQITAAATVVYRQALAALEDAPPIPAVPGKAPVKAAPRNPVIAKGQVLPRGVGNIPPQPKAADTRTVEEKLLAGDKDTIKQFENIHTEFFGNR